MGIFGYTKKVGRKCMEWADANQHQGTFVHWCGLNHFDNAQGTTSLISWLYLAGDMPNQIGPGVTAICHDLPLLALLDGQWADRDTLKSYYPVGHEGYDKMRAQYIATGYQDLNHGQNSTLGHLVFFGTTTNEDSHVCIATGNKASDGTAQIVSLWCDPQVAIGPAPGRIKYESVGSIFTLLGGRDAGAHAYSIKPAWR